ncbi:hypothetical protein L6452_35024 [Arctium lappa]|uniref:Uncharacterized protein n=1 Tax=Arctium lappa TaxID=4217 RepID=A0ACB8YKY1_ARCLA|nr:hypothetical protein L6452_35024 [Arctium lappa]
MCQRRWMELLTDYDYKIEYHPGKANVVADALSRKEMSENLMMVATRSEVTPTLLEEIKRFQVEVLRSENLKAERVVGLISSLIENNNGLKCYSGRIWVPRLGDLRTIILAEAHKSKYSIHPGTNKMYGYLRLDYWWPGLKKDIAHYVERCLTCLQVKMEHQRPYGKLQPLEIPVWKWEQITMDFVTKLPRTPKGYDAIWVIVDRLTKSAHFLPIKETYSKERLTRLYIDEIVVRHGVTLSIVSDRDSRFPSNFWKSSWENHFPLIEFAYNNSYRASIKVCLYEMLYERKCRTPLCWNEVGERQLVGPELVQLIADKIVQVRERLKVAHDRQKSYVEKRIKDIEFQIGDRVMLKIDCRAKIEFLELQVKNSLDPKNSLKKNSLREELASLKELAEDLNSVDKMTSKDALSIETDVKPPVLFKEGPMVPPTVQIPNDESSDSEDGDEDRVQKMKTVPKDFAQYSEEQKSRFKADKQARSLLLQSIPIEIYIKIDNYKWNAKKMWDQVQKMMMGSKVGNQMKVANCINSYEEFKAKDSESLEETYERFVLLLNELSKNKVKKKQIENNFKFLSIMQPE